jgi:hypothetical protein
VSLRDTFLELGYVLIALGAVYFAWALLTGPLERFTARFSEPQSGVKPDPEDDPKT